MRALLVCCLAVLCALSVCAEADSAPAAARPDAEFFDVNDVSFLFPLPVGEAGVGKRLRLSPDEGPPRLSLDDYRTLVPSSKDPLFPGGQTNPLHRMETFKLVAIRVDPCAKDDPTAWDCRAEFRLVLQPVTWATDIFHPELGKVVDTLDAAFHFIYEVPFVQQRELIADLRSLHALARGRTRGHPLGVHPVLREEGLEGEYGTRLLQLFRRYARPGDLRVVTHLFTEHSDRWFFSKTEPVDGHLEHRELPFVGDTSQEVFSDGTAILRLRKPALGTDNVNVIVDTIFGGAGPFFALPAAEQQRTVDAALRIDNPLRHTPATVDCASCHVASRALRRAKLSDKFNNASDGNPNRYVVPDGISGTLEDMQVDNDYSTRAFGYFFKKPSLTRGTVNDSAKVADWINRYVDGGTDRSL